MGFGWKLTLSFALLFVIGGLCGSAITLTLGSLHRFTAKAQPQGGWEESTVRNLTRQLSLTPDQQVKVRGPIHDAIDKIRTTRQKTLQETNEIFDQTLAGLAPLLNEEQKAKLEEFRARRKARVHAAISKPTP